MGYPLPSGMEENLQFFSKQEMYIEDRNIVPRRKRGRPLGSRGRPRTGRMLNNLPKKSLLKDPTWKKKSYYVPRNRPRGRPRKVVGPAQLPITQSTDSTQEPTKDVVAEQNNLPPKDPVVKKSYYIKRNRPRGRPRKVIVPPPPPPPPPQENSNDGLSDIQTILANCASYTTLELSPTIFN